MWSTTPISVEKIAVHLGGRFEGDGTLLIDGISTLESATASCLSWVGSEELLQSAKTSKAGALLIPQECSISTGQTVIRVSDPDLALCDVLRLMAPPPDRMPAGVHPNAIVAHDANVDGTSIGPHVFVGTGARVGAGTQLYPGVYVGAHTTLGTDCCIWPHVVIREHISIGDRVIIHPHATIGADGFGYLQRDGQHVKIPHIGSVIIEDDVEIGAGSCIDRARSGVTRVGRGTKIDNLVQVGHNVDLGEHCIIIANCGIGGSARLGHHVVVAGQTAISDHVHIGDGAQIAAKSLVTRDVPAGKTFRGVPAVDLHQFEREQVSLRKLPKLIKTIRECGLAVRDLLKRVERLEDK